MGLKIYGIDVEETQYDDALFIQFWEEFLTDHLQQFSQPDIIELAPEDGEYELAFERAVRSLIDEDIFVSEQWLKAIELAVHIPDYWESSFFRIRQACTRPSRKGKRLTRNIYHQPGSIIIAPGFVIPTPRIPGWNHQWIRQPPPQVTRMHMPRTNSKTTSFSCGKASPECLSIWR